MQNIRLDRAVSVDKQVRAELAALPPLKILATDAPPIITYDGAKQVYKGIAVDLLCYVMQQLDIEFDISSHDGSLSISDKLRQVQSGQADAFIPLSYSAERAKFGLFTAPIYNSYYAFITRRGSGVTARNISDLAPYRVGYSSGLSLEPLLKENVPESQLQAFSHWIGNGLFQALREGTIDVAVFSQQVFSEKRYDNNLFDLEIIHVLYDHPRKYAIYFSTTPEHERLVEVFNSFMGAIDLSQSIMAHEEGERGLINSYLTQRHQRTILLVAIVSTAVLALVLLVAALRHRRLARLLKQQNVFIDLQRRALYNANKKLEALSYTDPLTELPNRRYFDTKAEEAYAHYLRTDSPLSVLVIDADHFKAINDNHGHAIGDDYLRKIAKVFANTVDSTRHVLARYGGEEFICLLEATPPKEAFKIADGIRVAIEQLQLPITKNPTPVATVSIGVATIEQGDPGLLTLLTEADAQLYVAKQNGRNRVCCRTIKA